MVSPRVLAGVHPCFSRELSGLLCYAESNRTDSGKDQFMSIHLDIIANAVVRDCSFSRHVLLHLVGKVIKLSRHFFFDLET